MGSRLSGWLATTFFERQIRLNVAGFCVAEKRPMRENARTCLTREGIVPARFFSPEIRASWKRCFDTGLDPFGDPTQIQISVSQLNRRREKSDLVRRFAKMEMENLHRQIAGSNFIIILGIATASFSTVLWTDPWPPTTPAERSPVSCGRKK